MTASTLQAAIRARSVASAYYIFNPRVTLIDVGWREKDGVSTGELAVRIHVREKPTQAVLESLSAQKPEYYIDKQVIPFPLVDIIKGNYPLSWWWRQPPIVPRARTFNPLKGGISISNERFYGYGTLGGIVEDRGTREKMILSNWHVLAGSVYAAAGLRIYQPAYGDGGGSQDTVANLARHAFDRGIDAAVAKLNGSRGWVNEQFDIGAVTGAKSPALGMQVKKSGRASEVSLGCIDGIEGEYPIQYEGFERTIRHVLRIQPQQGEDNVSTGGDSGSWWLEEDTLKAVALHFAGQDDPDVALGIDMTKVLDALNVDIAGLGEEPPPAVEKTTALEALRLA